MEQIKEKSYGPLGTIKLLNINVYNKDNQIIYSGIVDNAPQEIKELRYKKVENNSGNYNYYI